MPTEEPPESLADNDGARSRAPFVLLGIGIAMIIVGMLIVPTLLDDGDDEPTVDTPTTTGWERAYIYDGATGQGVAINPDGSIIEGYNDMGRYIDSRVIARSSSIAFIGETLEIGPIPADQSNQGRLSMDVPEEATISVLGVPDRLVMALHYEDGGDLVIIDADRRRSLDLAELLQISEPSFVIDDLKLEPSGEHFAIYNPENKETAVVSFGRPQPKYYKGRALALSKDRVVTTSIDDDGETNLNVFDEEGAVVTTVVTDPLLDATMDGLTTYLVSEDNDVMRLDDGADDLVQLAKVPDAKKIAVTGAGNRFVVDSPWGFTMLDESGSEIGQLRPGSGGVENPQRDSLCLATDVNELITRSNIANPIDSGPAVLRLEDLMLTEVGQLPIHSSTPDGCTASVQVGESDQFQLVSATAELDLNPAGDTPTVGPYNRMFISPNPNQWIAMQPDQSVGLFELVDGEPQLIADIPFPTVDYIVAAFVPSSTSP